VTIVLVCGRCVFFALLGIDTCTLWGRVCCLAFSLLMVSIEVCDIGDATDHCGEFRKEHETVAFCGSPQFFGWHVHVVQSPHLGHGSYVFSAYPSISYNVRYTFIRLEI
jgi:hypothetical protein